MRRENLGPYVMSFDGKLLCRGFWLYIWDIRMGSERYIYVGRTGDSSSCNAASPFQRISQHLDSRENAKGNALGKQLRLVSINPECCSYEMLAMGPLYPEQEDFETHKPIRDIVGALETRLATYLKGKGYCVIGQHSTRQEPDAELWTKVKKIVDEQFR